MIYFWITSVLCAYGVAVLATPFKRFSVSVILSETRTSGEASQAHPRAASDDVSSTKTLRSCMGAASHTAQRVVQNSREA